MFLHAYGFSATKDILEQLHISGNGAAENTLYNLWNILLAIYLFFYFVLYFELLKKLVKYT